MFRMLMLLVALVPIAASAYPDVRLDKQSCHAVHHKTQQQFVTQLPGCDVTFYNPHNRYWMNRMWKAIGQTSRYGLQAKDVPAVPVVEDPNESSCISVPTANTYRCWVFDRNSKLFLSRRTWFTNTRVCSVPNTDLFNATYHVECLNNSEASPEEVECVRKIVAGEMSLNTLCLK